MILHSRQARKAVGGYFYERRGAAMEEMDTSKVIRVCGIEPESIVDGPGFRYVLFVQGCPHHCKGCHNPESWDPNGGYDMTVRDILDEIKAKPNIKGVTFSGGEPFEQARALVDLARYLKGMRYSLMSYSGYTLEELDAKAESDSAVGELLGMIDILVDGRYEEKLRNLTLVYCGSENQRVIDMNKTREARAAGKGDEVVLYKSDFDFEIKII
jgi:anaerobic ribonucleoside-triphosphate reductase activating protein